MNKNAIKKFAIDARNKLIASVTDKAGMLGITPDNCSEAITKGADFEVYKTAAGTEVTLNKKQCEQRRKLVDQIHARGFEAVVEEVAYTWFNRICAIRFMEVNDYMYPVRVRVLSSEKEGKNEPDVVTMAPDIDWDFTDKEREEIIDAKMNNRLDDLFRMLFIKQCNLLHEVLPGLFEETEDYTEMLLNISFTNEDDVIRMLVDGIDEKDFNITTVDEDGKAAGQVEIIGWLYQYYNTEPKNKAFAKKAKITKEEIPAVTQLFTPDWIVRYMVENSLGRMWLEGHPDEELKSKWKYYLDEAEQEESVQHELNKIKAEYATLKPEDIKLIDPCMGSGHILVYNIIVDHGTAKPAKNIKEIRELLGVLPEDNLINASHVLVVEGEDDKIALNKILSSLSPTIKDALIKNKLVIQPLAGATNLNYELSRLRSYVCRYFVFLDADEAGYDAAEKAIEKGLLSESDVKYSICNGNNTAEFEDCLKKDFYIEAIRNKFSVDLGVTSFRNSKKWSDRVKTVFLSQGQRWTDAVEKKVKMEVTKLIPVEDADSVLDEHKRGSIDALVNALENMLSQR